MINEKQMKIGVFGGTFDPPHIGHLIIAEEAREQLNLTKVIFVPAFTPPHKQPEGVATPLQRYRMVALAIQGNSFFEVSQLELKRKGISYTLDTLRALKERYPKAELFLILGSDNLLDFHTWKSPSKILAIASLVVYEREGFEMKEGMSFSQARPIKLSGAGVDISSSSIRKRVRAGKSIRYMVPTAVERYIDENKLYKTRKDS